MENPPIMKLSSWTRAAPFKEEKHHRSPSESIGNNFTPAANNLKLKFLRKRRSLCKNSFKKSIKVTLINTCKCNTAPVRLNSSYPPPLKKSPPPCPMPEGFHHHQLAGIAASPSRPMTPGEQFQRIDVHQKWERAVAGEPNEADLKVLY